MDTVTEKIKELFKKYATIEDGESFLTFDDFKDALEELAREEQKPEAKELNLQKYKQNAEENYVSTPISVLRYITELEEASKEQPQPQQSKEEQKKLIIDIMHKDEEAGLYDSQPQQEADKEKTALSIAMEFSEKFQDNYPDKIHLWELMDELRVSILKALSEADKGEPK